MMHRYPYDGFYPVSCFDCCEVEDCPVCLDVQHENCEIEGCEYCRRQADDRHAKAYCDAQFEYYAPGGIFENLMGLRGE